MTTSSKSANVYESSPFAEVVRFCAVGLLLSLAFLIVVPFTLEEWF
jgi:hypothetical protein